MDRYLLVFLGGGIGSLVRYGFGRTLIRFFPQFPAGTLAANVTGMFLIGLFTVWFLDKNMLGSPYREFVLVGFLGGLTTFSSFGYESYVLVTAQRWLEFGVYFCGNVVAGLALFLLGRKLGAL